MPLAEFRALFPNVCARLLKTRLNERIGHAYLFVGDDAETLEPFARSWAAVCACSDSRADGDACGQCRSCHLLATGNYPHCHVLTPTSKSREITISEVRDFEHELSLAAGAGAMKLGLVLDADCLGLNAQNAFLKTLEEPTPDTILCLTTAQPQRLLPTIRSRCQIVALRRNRRSYAWAAEQGLPDILAPLRPRAGATAGLEAGARLAALFAQLHERAEACVEEQQDANWDVVADGDEALQKRLKTLLEARVEAEYRRLRQALEDAIQTWYLQVYLLAAGVSPAALPHPELFPDGALEQPPPPRPDALRAVHAVERLLACLQTSVDERLAIDAFCLSLTQR
jgi:DNA polymerase III delta prime subunit